jgi:hypothetical protein
METQIHQQIPKKIFFSGMLNDVKLQGDVLFHQEKMNITISSYDYIKYEEWTLSTCLEDLE